MKLVIDVPDGNYKALKKMSGCGLGVYHEMILNGTPLAEELEKIKAEFSDLQKAHHIWLIDQYALIDECSEIIDKHIAELKGE